VWKLFSVSTVVEREIVQIIKPQRIHTHPRTPTPTHAKDTVSQQDGSRIHHHGQCHVLVVLHFSRMSPLEKQDKTYRRSFSLSHN
jgi:hypothetical protein